MKTTIDLTPGKSLTVEPCAKRGGIVATLEMKLLGMPVKEFIHMTPEKAMELVTGMAAAMNALPVGAWATTPQDMARYEALTPGVQMSVRERFDSECG